MTGKDFKIGDHVASLIDNDTYENAFEVVDKIPKMGLVKLDLLRDTKGVMEKTGITSFCDPLASTLTIINRAGATAHAN